MMNIVNNRCEVNRLKKMIVHRPGEELNNLVPHYLEIQLFDDIPWLSMAQKEHDEYVKVLKSLGVEVYELIDLVADSIGDNKDLLKELVERFIAEANIYGTSKREYIHDYLLEKSPQEAIDIMISGFRKSEINVKGNHLSDMLSDDYPFVLDPMPNAYFTRDPFSFVGNGIIISKMYKQARSRETLFGSFIMEHNPLFKDTPIYYNRDGRFAVEGGDIMVLSPDTLAIGVSQRTNANAVEEIARNILSDEKNAVSKPFWLLIFQKQEAICILTLYLLWWITINLQFILM
jgi:Arginine deiminase